MDKILESAALKKADTVLEIGAGLGTLTQALAQKAGQIIAVEKDKELIPILKENLKEYKNVEIVCADILDLLKNSKFEISPPASLRQRNSQFKIIGNIPYYLTSRLLRLLLDSKSLNLKPQAIILTLQKEVAERIMAKPPRMNLLALSVQFFAKPKLIAQIPKNAFWPQPEVESTIIKLKTQKAKRKTATQNEKHYTEKFFYIAKSGFASPRKQLASNLAKNFGLDKNLVLNCLKNCKIESKARAENISVKKWLCLAEKLKALLVDCFYRQN